MNNTFINSIADRKYRDALRAIEILEGSGHVARLAGGCVRDRLLGCDPVDFDIATNAIPENVLSLFRSERIRAIPTGIEHGTVTIVMPTGPVEVTTLRRDVATDGRYARVVFGQSFEEDAARRDFTINALFEDRCGQIYDYHGGRQDLTAGILRFVGEAATRIREDYLRILRFFRFQARFGYSPAQGTLAAIEAHAPQLNRISQERITGELLKTVSARAALIALEAMFQCKVTAYVLPELAIRRLPEAQSYAALRHAFGRNNPPATLALAFFLLQGGQPRLTTAELHALGLRLRLPNREAAKLAFAGDALSQLPRLQSRSEILGFIDTCEKAASEPGAFESLFAPLLNALGLDTSRISETELLFGHLRRARLPLDGRRLQLELGLSSGPELGRILEHLRREYRDGIWETPEQGLIRAVELAKL